MGLHFSLNAETAGRSQGQFSGGGGSVSSFTCFCAGRGWQALQRTGALG